MPQFSRRSPLRPAPTGRLEHLIVTLQLAPDSTATEGALIERVGLGRTPVREAIQRLAWEGLLDVRPRSGIVIAPLRPDDWLRVIDARRGVEVVLARSAARFVTPEAAELFAWRRARHAEGRGGGQRARLPEGRPVGGRGAGAGGRQSVCRAARSAAADPQPALLVSLQGRDRACRNPPSIMSRWCAPSSTATRTAAAKAAKRLMALLRAHAEVAARR